MKKLGYILIFISIAFIIFTWLGEFITKDMCLDSGQVYDYATSSCRSDIQTSKYVPFTVRFLWELFFSTALLIAGILLIVKSKKVVDVK